ncbi:MAG TPA: hypothetical protein VF297_07775 [Pyrinomonadaceae bacterium]
MTTETRMGVGIRDAASGVREGRAAVRKLYGLVELDSSGTVLYARFEGDAAPPLGVTPDYTGLNFYAEVAPFRNVVEFRNQLDRFSRGSQPAYSMDFTCDCEDGPVPVRVLLARIRECSRTDATGSVLVHIRRAP